MGRELRLKQQRSVYTSATGTLRELQFAGLQQMADRGRRVRKFNRQVQRYCYLSLMHIRPAMVLLAEVQVKPFMILARILDRLVRQAKWMTGGADAEYGKVHRKTAPSYHLVIGQHAEPVEQGFEQGWLIVTSPAVEVTKF